MAADTRLKLRDGDRLIDAEFSVTVTGTDSFEITLESSGGGPKRNTWRNRDYPEGLTEVLRRIAPVASSLDDCLVSSTPALALPENLRRVPPTAPYSYPVILSTSEDFERLRLALTSPQVDVASTASKGGNQRKKITMKFTARQPGISVDDIVSALDATTSPRRDRKDIAAGLTKGHIDAAREEWQRIGGDEFHRKYGTRRAAKFVIADPDGIEYDAKAILFAARFIAGLDGVNADFDGDRATVQQPLENLGYVVEDITQPDAEESLDRSAEARARAIRQAQDFAGQTDAKAERTVRREQRLLRQALGLDNSSHECTLCGKTFPDRLLVAAHIKKRSECSPEEKMDIPSIAMIACSLGCDALFEHGYIVVDDDGVISPTGKAAEHPHLMRQVSALAGRRLGNPQAASAPYFAWHRNKFLS